MLTLPSRTLPGVARRLLPAAHERSPAAAARCPDAFLQRDDLFLSPFRANTRSGGRRGNGPSWRRQAEEPRARHRRGHCGHRDAPRARARHSFTGNSYVCFLRAR